MANTGGKEVIDTSSIINMEVMDGNESDYETSISGNIAAHDDDRYGQKPQSTPYMEDVQKKVTQNVASYVWQSGSQQAKTYLNTYANIDLLRPYFNVEPYEVRQRLVQSLMPRKPGSPMQPEKVPRELYGPTMLIFTMIALLLYQMKTGGHTVQEGTLMGTAFATCFGYWFGVSSFVWFLAYVCNAHITMLQILSLLGYALFGHCIVLGITMIFHTTHDHVFFYLMWAIFGGLSTLRMVSVMMSRTAGQTQRLIVCGVLAALHLCFLLYLHFAYHQMVEDLSDLMKLAGLPQVGKRAADIRRLPTHGVIALGHLPDTVPKYPPGLGAAARRALLPQNTGGPADKLNHDPLAELLVMAPVLKPDSRGQLNESLSLKMTAQIAPRELPKAAHKIDFAPKALAPEEGGRRREEPPGGAGTKVSPMVKAGPGRLMEALNGAIKI